MPNTRFSNKLAKIRQSVQSLLMGDWLTIFISLCVIVYLFQTQWSNVAATKVQIRVADKVYATFSLNQQRKINVTGSIGETTIQISQGKVRFLHAPCHNQYCVQQAWLTRAGQVAICLPNQVTLALLGDKPLYDSLNY